MDKRLTEIQDRLEWLKNTERRGRELASTIPAACIYVGLCGTGLAFDEFRLSDEIGIVRKVSNAPGIVHVCCAADISKTDYLGVSRYSAAIRAELALGVGKKHQDIDLCLDLGFHTAALMKLRSHSSLSCPCFATASWDTITAIKDNSVVFGLLDDVPRHIKGIDLEPVTEEDMRWVDKVWNTALGLRGLDRSRRFGLAFNVAYIWNQTTDMRLALANLWCGIEALFGDKRDRPVTGRVVQRICGWLPALSADEVEASYNRRCDAVHGRWLGDNMKDAILKAEEILRQALLRCIEADAIPLPDWQPDP
jgi:hypothetical protein